MELKKPTMFQMRTAKKRLTQKAEAGVIGALVLLRHMLPLISDSNLMDILQVCLSLYLQDISWISYRHVAPYICKISRGYLTGMFILISDRYIMDILQACLSLYLTVISWISCRHVYPNIWQIFVDILQVCSVSAY